MAGTLWPESSTAQSRKYLRQSLWRLRALGAADGGARLVNADSEWVQAEAPNLWLDVAELEEAFARVKLLPGEQTQPEQAQALKRVEPLYGGDLLEGCYQDWCVYERERLKAIYVSLLEKLLGYCESHGETEEGLIYGDKLLRHDRAHERAHWRLMRLRYLAGDRTGALRQFERCREVLKEELGVAPGQRIRSLCERIRADANIDGPTRSLVPADPPALGDSHPVAAAGDHPQAKARSGRPPGAPSPAVASLQGALEALSLAERLVQQSIRAVQDRQ